MWEFCWFLGKFCHGYQNQIYFALSRSLYWFLYLWDMFKIIFTVWICLVFNLISGNFLVQFCWGKKLFSHKHTKFVAMATTWDNFHKFHQKKMFTYELAMTQPSKWYHKQVLKPPFRVYTPTCNWCYILCTHIILIPFIMFMDLFALLSHKECHFTCIIDALRPNTCTNLTSNDQCTRRIGLSLTRIYEDFFYAHLLHWNML